MTDKPDTIEYKGHILGKVGGCTLLISYDDKGKGHIEATCASKEAREHLAAILEEEAILRVNPKVLLEDIPDITPERPPAEPVTEPAPDTRLNPSES